jgi:hypothetical protein
MKIKMRTTASGPAGCHQAGQVYEVSSLVAEAYLQGGYAEAVKEQHETATLDVPETPEVKAPAPRRGRSKKVAE